jgi:hypothetical protein
MDNNNQMLGGSTAEMDNQTSNFSANEANSSNFSAKDTNYNNTSASMNASENFTSNSDSYVNSDITNNGVSNGVNNGVNNNHSNYTTTSTTSANGGRQHESGGCLPIGILKQEVKTAAKGLFGMGRHKKGCQHGNATTTTSTCSCTNQATCPHSTQNSSYGVSENCNCNESDTYNSTTLSDNKTSNFASNGQESNSFNTSNSFNNSASDNYNATEKFSGQAEGGFSESDSTQMNGVGGEQFSSGGPVGGNNY